MFTWARFLRVEMSLVEHEISHTSTRNEYAKGCTSYLSFGGKLMSYCPSRDRNNRLTELSVCVQAVQAVAQLFNFSRLSSLCFKFPLKTSKKWKLPQLR